MIASPRRKGRQTGRKERRTRKIIRQREKEREKQRQKGVRFEIFKKMKVHVMVFRCYDAGVTKPKNKTARQV
jgi:hypothetical protein